MGENKTDLIPVLDALNKPNATSKISQKYLSFDVDFSIFVQPLLAPLHQAFMALYTVINILLKELNSVL